MTESSNQSDKIRDNGHQSIANRPLGTNDIIIKPDINSPVRVPVKKRNDMR